METGKNGNICLQIEFLCFFLELSISIITVEMMINDNTGIFHLFELRIGMNEFDHRSFYRCLSSSKKGLKNSGLNGDSNPDLCDAGVVLHQFSYQANW